MKQRLRRQVARAAAIAVIAVSAWLTQLPSYSAAEQARLAAQFSFQRIPLAVAAKPTHTIRSVEPSLQNIAGWISSVGAAVSLSDIDGDGLPNDVCLVDPRSNTVTVEPATGTGIRYRPFVLSPAPLPYDAQTTAPMGCLPGDFNEDGRLDLLVYYWGRTPVLFLRKPGTPLGPSGFIRRELVPGGGRWYTDSVLAADLTGDGHLDLVVGNYFPDGARVLDARAKHDPAMQMQDSMSRAINGGTNRILLWRPGGRYVEAKNALPPFVARGWTLAIGAADLTGDLLPDLYFANDFGPDRLLHNESTPGHLRLKLVSGSRGFFTPASQVLGHDSFKGMGVAFGDLTGRGKLGIFVSNIAAPYALEESNFAFVPTGPPSDLAQGQAPYTNQSEQLGLSRSGWAWDAKIGDFADTGENQIVQATGFLRGSVDRWPELQELAMANDTLIHHPSVWPRFQAGDDLSGHQHVMFYVRGPAGRYVDLSPAVGLGKTVVSRGIATGDVNGDGRLDLAIADQWALSYLYMNHAPGPARFLGLRLLLPPAGTKAMTRILPGHPGGLMLRPAIGAEATVDLPDGRKLIGQLDDGNGHASVSAPELLFGLRGSTASRVTVRLAWRDGFGLVHRSSLSLRPGWHTIVLAQGTSR
jgi:enediyne biosynthesis protein E4